LIRSLVRIDLDRDHESHEDEDEERAEAIGQHRHPCEPPSHQVTELLAADLTA
jgi:hypothetical protein